MEATTKVLMMKLALMALAWPTVKSMALHTVKDVAPKVVGMETTRRPVTNPVKRDLLRRRQTATMELDNEETLYFIDAKLGTPAQSVRLHLDTGSSDLWVNTPRSSFCLEQEEPCQYAGVYAANTSSTYEYIGSRFNISYVDGSGAAGDYVSDTVTLGTTKLDRLQFGIGYTSSSSQGILGIGYEANEVQVSRAGQMAYRNLPSQMVEDGHIKSNAYSLWLNDLSANKGQILFGGVDTEKYTGSLQSLPIQTATGKYREFLLTLTSLHLDSTAVASNLALAVLLDSGASLTYLPDAIASTIFSQVGAQYDAEVNAAYVPCSLARSTSQLVFGFSAPTIAVDMNEMVLDLLTTNGERPTFENGQAACLFGIAPAGSGTNVLGDTFLRSAYVVYDLDNNRISLAQTRFNSTSSNVQEITTGPDSVPDATLIANSVKAMDGLSGNAAGGLRAAGPTAMSMAAAIAVSACCLTMLF